MGTWINTNFNALEQIFLKFVKKKRKNFFYLQKSCLFAVELVSNKKHPVLCDKNIISIGVAHF
ncbi:MAG: hypothetical protein RL329_1472 [Bacteroidota bacterium]